MILLIRDKVVEVEDAEEVWEDLEAVGAAVLEV
jgi:hypothetical protein